MIYIEEIKTFIQQHMILCAIWIVLLVLVISTSINNWIFRNSEIKSNKAVLLINKKNAIVIDIRNKDDYKSGHIINSLHILISDIKNNNIYKLKKFKKSPLIIVHDNNIIAHSVRRNLCKLKFEEVYVLHGGIIGWKTGNFPVLLK
ncbi:rhodanese-like domain-containing protein [Candidatus Blochmannia ocreatus (nom. nud.)]|uniref:Rhodanese-like domain-containing protein n=1 Tax=Candidatus Blochmannia ocreatus (nom. nud.) TaxID=251538 RepID=A0ABY4SUC1_9ENTR|nr:rhodanese-like domain-containing protein [Candidatus Blochmannia ocreatus]URJ25073.1 rhodanese-like domain-containing protein [Candidatus Blochmannia ocreatus]